MILFKKKREKTTKDLPTIEEFWESFNKSKAEWEAHRAESEAEAKARKAEWEERFNREHAEWEERFNREHDEWEARQAKSEAEAKARQAEWEARQAKSEAEAKARQAVWDERMKRLDQKIGHIGNTVGFFAEDFFAAKSAELLTPYGYTFKRVFQQIPVYNKEGRTLTEIDLMLSNGEYGMVIEVKTCLKKEDVNLMLDKMEKIKNNPPAEIAGKKLLCGVAGINVKDDARERAFELGFFVFEQSSDTITLTKPPEDFKPAEWQG